MLGNSCAGCHGTNGVSYGPAAPTIAGFSAEYTIEAMKEYKSDERASTIMGRIARGYSDDEIKAMAEFFAKQKFMAADQKIDTALVGKGKKLHDKYCEKCHEDEGTSNADDAGLLAGQWMPYMHYTMEDFISGKRSMPKKMKKKVEKMQKKEGDEAMKALLNFYASKK
jgi:sulfide dehydrogenase cytochrome subunit